MSDVKQIEDQITEAGAVTLDDSDLEAVHGGAYEFYMKREDWHVLLPVF